MVDFDLKAPRRPVVVHPYTYVVLLAHDNPNTETPCYTWTEFLFLADRLELSQAYRDTVHRYMQDRRECLVIVAWRDGV